MDSFVHPDCVVVLLNFPNLMRCLFVITFHAKVLHDAGKRGT